MNRSSFLIAAVLVASIAIGGRANAGDASGALPFPLIKEFTNFRMKDGLPSRKVHSVLPDQAGKLWLGTWDGLVVRENGAFRRYGPEHGLSHKMVLCVVEDPATADLWIGTMRGLNRFSGGRFTTYTQTSSGIPNNVVYALEVVGDTLWVATAAGLGALDTKSGSWKLYDHTNTPMHEPWVYSVKWAVDRLYVGVWGGGIIEHDPAKASFKAHRDPDGDFHFDLTPDDGPISDVTSWLAWSDGVLWQASYFGLARYDGSRWRTWVEKKSPLASNFINFIWPSGKFAWIGTDRGVSVTDGDSWATYRTDADGKGVIEITRPEQPVEVRASATTLANDYVLGIWTNDREAWFATSDGLSHAILAAPEDNTRIAEAR